MIAHALQVVGDLHRRHEEPEVLGHGLLRREQADDPLLDLELEGVDGAPIEEILADGGERARRVAAADGQARGDEPVYSPEEEAVILERLRDLGYE